MDGQASELTGLAPRLVSSPPCRARRTPGITGRLWPQGTVSWRQLRGLDWGRWLQRYASSEVADVQRGFRPHLRRITKFSRKPMMIAEMGSVENKGDKAEWITDALTVQLPKQFPQVHGIIWFNVDCGNGLDWRIESSPEANQAFRSAIQSDAYSSNTFSNLDISPIPPLQ